MDAMLPQMRIPQRWSPITALRPLEYQRSSLSSYQPTRLSLQRIKKAAKVEAEVEDMEELEEVITVSLVSEFHER